VPSSNAIGGRLATGIDHESPKRNKTPTAAGSVGTTCISADASVIPASPMSVIRRLPNRAPSQPAGIDPINVDTATAMKPSDAFATVV